MSYSLDEIMKMYGQVFLYSNPLGSNFSIQIHWEAILSFATSRENLDFSKNTEIAIGRTLMIRTKGAGQR